MQCMNALMIKYQNLLVLLLDLSSVFFNPNFRRSSTFTLHFYSFLRGLTIFEFSFYFYRRWV